MSFLHHFQVHLKFVTASVFIWRVHDLLLLRFFHKILHVAVICQISFAKKLEVLNIPFFLDP